MADLFDYRDKYPKSAGFKRSGTSQDAAEIIRPKVITLRDQVLAALKSLGPMTPDECAAHLGKSVLGVRPRLSELMRLGLICESGDRRPNASGLKANV
jgi:predicted HTH transcriptional regulator